MVMVDRSKFLNACQSCEPGLADREIIDQSKTFAFVDGKIWSFNDRAACCVESPLGKDFTGAISAEPLLNLLNKLQEETIEVNQVDGEMLVKGRNRRAGIRMEMDVRLPIKVVEKPEEWKKLPEDFCDAIGLVQGCAGSDESKFNLTCVHVTPRWVESCNNFQLCRWNLETTFSEPALLQKRAIKHLSSMGAVEFSETSSWVHFKGPHGLVYSCRRYTDVTDFPDLSKNLQIKGEPFEIPKGLEEAIDKAQVFTAIEGDENDEVSIELKQGKLKIKGNGPQGWFEERKKITYDGRAISFLIPSKVLLELAKKHKKCFVTEDHLMVDGGHYKFVTCLDRPNTEVKLFNGDKLEDPE